jgi:hypothetical protein
MKVSQLISDIISEAEHKFGLTNSEGEYFHINGCISIWLFPDGNTWQVGLQRPTQRMLDFGEIENGSTTRVTENRVAFYTQKDTLLKALQALQDKVSSAAEWDFDL